MTATPQLPPTVTPVMLEIIKGALRSAQAEMERLLQRTGMSPVIREKQDYFCGLYDRQGRLLVGTKVPILGNVMGPVLENYPIEDMQPGDVFWYDDPYLSKGGVSHTPDQVFITPIFVDEKVAGFTMSWAHFLDIGGTHPGSTTPDATDIMHEGILIPPVRLYRAGVLNEDLFKVFLRNTRLPEMAKGDVRAMMASIELGRRRMLELYDRYGVETAHDAFEYLIKQSRDFVRSRMREIFKPGSYSFTEIIDTDGHGTTAIAIRLTITVDGDKLIIDGRETDDQTKGPINFIMHPSALQQNFGIYAMAPRPDLMFNEGIGMVFDEVLLREGSVIQPKFPAPLGQRSVALFRVTSACMGLIAVARPDLAIGSTSAYSANKLRGKKLNGTNFLKTLGIAAGQGARPTNDGPDAIYLLNQQNYPLEFAEQNYPLLMRRYSMNTDSGGPGRWRGGCGVIREFEVLTDDAQISLRMSNVEFPTFGVNGGMSGRSGRFVVNPGRENEVVLPTLIDGVVLKRGDIMQIMMPGGGGFGHPFDREPERVLRDVLTGMVSAESALKDYGVVLDLANEAFDAEATADYRAQNRWETEAFHRRRYYSITDWNAAMDAASRSKSASAR